MRRVAVLCAGVLASGLLSSSTALATGDDGDHRWIAVEDDVAFVLPDGTTFTEDDPPMAGQEQFAPPVGTRLFLGEALYETDDGSTRGDAVGRTHIECTVQTRPTDFLCGIAFVFDAGSQLHGVVQVEVSTEGMDPDHFDIAVTGGTGDYSGARGVVSLQDISATEPGEETVTRYEAHLE
jgi:hypothetical protein